MFNSLLFVITSFWQALKPDLAWKLVTGNQHLTYSKTKNKTGSHLTAETYELFATENKLQLSV